MCMNQRQIKRRDMHVDGFESELHETRIQYKILNMHNHSLSSKGYSTSKNKHTIACIWEPYKSRD